jgi:hypothetical protein
MPSTAASGYCSGFSLSSFSVCSSPSGARPTTSVKVPPRSIQNCQRGVWGVWDLDGHYRLEGFTLAYSDPDGASFTSLNLADVFRSHFADPWDGATPSVIMAPLGGQYTELQMRFVLAPANNVPEPGGLALAGLGLAALGRRLRGRAMMA